MNQLTEVLLWAALCLNGGSPVAWIDHNGAHTVSRFHNLYVGWIDFGLDYRTYTESETKWQVVKYYKSAFTPLEPWTRVESMHDAQGAVVEWKD